MTRYAKWTRWGLLALGCMGGAVRAQIEIEPGEMPVRTPLPPIPGGSNPARTPAAPKVKDHRPAADVVFFGGGDRLSGEWVSGFGSEPGISWLSSHGQAPTAFKADRLVAMLLKARPAPGFTGQGGQVELAGGDLVPGNLAELTADRAVLDTWFGGRIHVDRSALFRVIPASLQSQVLYEGPGTGEGWIQPAGEQAPFAFRRGVMLGQNNGMASLSLNFPERYQVSMEMRSRTGQFYVQIGLQVDKPNQNSDGYWVELMQHFIRFSRRSAKSGHQYLGNVQRQQMMQLMKPMQIHILVDRKAGTVGLVMDGEMVQTWSVGDDSEFKGKNLVMMLQNTAGYEIRNFRVALWDGRMPDANAPQPQVADQDMLKFLNEDSLSGTLGTILAGKASFKTSFADMEVPVERVESIVLAGRRTAPKFAAGARKVLITFWGRGQLTADLKRMEQETLVVHHPAMGEIRIPLGAIERVDFNLDAPWRKDEDLSELVADGVGGGAIRTAAAAPAAAGVVHMQGRHQLVLQNLRQAEVRVQGVQEAAAAAGEAAVVREAAAAEGGAAVRANVQLQVGGGRVRVVQDGVVVVDE